MREGVSFYIDWTKAYSSEEGAGLYIDCARPTSMKKVTLILKSTEFEYS